MARLFDDAASEYLEIDTAPVASPPFTMACWFNSDSDSLPQVLMYLGDKDIDWPMHALYAAGNYAGDPVLLFGHNGVASTEALTTSGYSANVWQHACAVCAATNDRRAYVNGGSKGTSATNIVVAGLDRISIGRRGRPAPSGDRYTSGAIAEAAIWDVALTDAEVALLATGLSPLLLHPESLVFYAPLIRSEDRDIVGGLTLTAYNTPSVAAHPRIYYPHRRLTPGACYTAPIIVPHAGRTATPSASLRTAYLLTGSRTATPSVSTRTATA